MISKSLSHSTEVGVVMVGVVGEYLVVVISDFLVGFVVLAFAVTVVVEGRGGGSLKGETYKYRQE